MNKGILSKACVCVFFSVALPLCAALPTPPPGTNPKAELLRQGSCPEGLYPSASLCCLNCPAGEHQVSPCSSDRGSSVCSECPMGTFTEHSNHLRTCLTCTRCRPDQEEVQPCSPTNNTVCRCKSGYFCAHDQACEVCQRCRSCNDGETRVKSCTAHSNSECAKTSTPGTPTEGRSPDSGSAPLALWWILGVGVGVGFAFLGVWVYKKRRPWLTCLPSLSPGQSQQNEDDSLLVPLNGEKSLKLCFEYFHVDMDSKVHKRFFRSLDLSDNAINDANNEDRVYELLDVWLQREGQEAKLHHLLQKLRDLDQNRTADSIVEKAIANGHYERGGISHPSYSGKSDE
ncbi:tumor necrosis factor receptor superfamily member 10B isoform X3 [Gadus morhua]|uniref:tumor necrosis factor receptor superfamily member 10B isoform X3 n=1 Tax=Gadus morhua TaxID=8049 RepID=UPI0011B364DD|nr:tumor necrosis factor receptor superfamily member 10B-like isoform X3 [Gadus morhua]